MKFLELKIGTGMVLIIFAACATFIAWKAPAMFGEFAGVLTMLGGLLVGKRLGENNGNRTTTQTNGGGTK
jgi:hypothetical protein